MPEHLSFMKVFSGELLIILGLIIIINSYIGNVNQTIKADGEGYYDYLPALFIYKDFPSKGLNRATEYSKRIKNLDIYIDYKGMKIDKYPCGTAILLAPFFIYAHLTAPLQGEIRDGFSKPYQRSVFYGAIFYLFIGLIFFKRLLTLYNISPLHIFLVQILIVLGTSITNYINYDASFSHVYSLFAVSTFFFFTKSYFENNKTKYFIWACAILGLIIIIRQINILVVLFIPFLAGTYHKLKSGIIQVISHSLPCALGIALMLGIFFIQALLWYIQTGSIIIYSYHGEKFDFLNPAFWQLLFSYKKGLFIYTPVTFISIFGLLIFLISKQYYQFFTWLTSFILITYLLSSWWSWDYGCSYGPRGYIEYYPAFFILLAILIQQSALWLKVVVISLSLLTVPLNIIQTRQYKKNILHWTTMDKEKYWKVFLKTSDRYIGLLWKKEYYFNNSTTDTIYSISLEDITVPANIERDIYIENTDSIEGFDNVNIIQVVFDNRFNSKEEAMIELSVRDSVLNKIYYYHKISLILFSETKLNYFHTGQFNFEFEPIVTESNKKIILKTCTKDNDIFLENLKINFLDYE